MPPIRVNRRRFLGCSAAASLAISQGNLAEASGAEASAAPVRLGLIGIGNRGTSLARSLLELPGASIVAVCDAEPKHRLRGQGIVEKVERPPARGLRRPAPAAGSQGRGCGRDRAALRPARAAVSRRDRRGEASVRREAAGTQPGRLRSPGRRGGRRPRAGGARRLPEAIEPPIPRGDRADRPGRAGDARRRRGRPGPAATGR